MRAQLPPKYYQVEEAVRRVQTQEITLESFVDFLEDILEEFEDAEDDIQDTDLPRLGADEVEDDLESGLVGIEACKAALERLALFVEDTDPEHLKAGLAMFAAGLESLVDLATRNNSALQQLQPPGTESFTLG